MNKNYLWLICILLFLLYNNFLYLCADDRKEIEIHICGTKEKPQIKCLKGQMELFNISLERYEIKNSVFIAQYKIQFPGKFTVKMDNDVTGYDALGNPVKIITSGFTALDKSSFNIRYFLKLVSYSLQDKTSVDKYSIILFIPQNTYDQYSFKEVSSNTYLLERKAEVNPRLMAALSYQLGVNNNIFLKAIPDDFEISISWTENGTTFFFEKVFYLPW